MFTTDSHSELLSSSLLDAALRADMDVVVKNDQSLIRQVEEDESATLGFECIANEYGALWTVIGVNFADAINKAVRKLMSQLICEQLVAKLHAATSLIRLTPAPTRATVCQLLLNALEVYDRKPGSAQDKRKKGRHAGRVRLAIASDQSANALCGFADCAVMRDSLIVTDDWGGYASVGKGISNHHAIAKWGDPKVAEEFRSIIHLVFSNGKAWRTGMLHGVSANHLQAYLDKFPFRFNRRVFPLNAFRFLLWIPGNTGALTFTELYWGEWQLLLYRGVCVYRIGTVSLVHLQECFRLSVFIFVDADIVFGADWRRSIASAQLQRKQILDIGPGHVVWVLMSLIIKRLGQVFANAVRYLGFTATRPGTPNFIGDLTLHIPATPDRLPAARNEQARTGGRRTSVSSSSGAAVVSGSETGTPSISGSYCVARPLTTMRAPWRQA